MRAIIEFLKRFDYLVFLPIVVLLTFSVFFVYSAGINSYGLSVSNEWQKQIMWASIGMMLFFTLTVIDYQRYRDMAVVIYIVNLVLLLAVLIIGTKISGAKRWLGIGPFGIQPAEFAKIGFILIIARFLSSYGRNPRHASTLGISGFLVMLPMILILRQPDFGTSMVFLAILGMMLFMAGGSALLLTFFVTVIAWFLLLIFFPLYFDLVKERDIWLTTLLSSPYWLGWVGAVTLVIIVTSLAGWFTYRKWIYLISVYLSSSFGLAVGLTWLAHQRFQPYQWDRLRVFVNPQIDPLGAGWHILQSLTAIGSGGVYGRGYLGGVHSHNQFLPEQSTDFIFSIILEETGFIGAVVLLLAYGTLLLRLLFLMSKARDKFSMLVIGGTFSLLLIHVWINIGMVIGLMPIKGVPLFLLSYGGSSVLSMMILLGIVSSISLRQYR
ncbi:rod shape-determining protein RodA [Entomospira entomophila]|uniref:Cell wall polymerase n=1 Tax=Entomospira entomophila TaxID=2719988 RepID=A0A968KRA4_9SPIO|nr:rod shape-determining protein RodA [Entomospira entomophilus]NIZ40528.1 rod shape-determining protein RodA [Entomospira entomophilus]WDI36086.1 rod shape-determining protein RodA [Entomospira entomophilus]